MNARKIARIALAGLAGLIAAMVFYGVVEAIKRAVHLHDDETGLMYVTSGVSLYLAVITFSYVNGDSTHDFWKSKAEVRDDVKTQVIGIFLVLTLNFLIDMAFRSYHSWISQLLHAIFSLGFTYGIIWSMVQLRKYYQAESDRRAESIRRYEALRPTDPK